MDSTITNNSLINLSSLPPSSLSDMFLCINTLTHFTIVLQAVSSNQCCKYCYFVDCSVTRGIYFTSFRPGGRDLSHVALSEVSTYFPLLIVFFW